MKNIFPNIQKHPLGFYEVADKPTRDELQDYYAKKYYQGAHGSYEASYSEAELQHILGKSRLRIASMPEGIPETGAMLDVGCGEGFVLSVFKEMGRQVKGIDFSCAGIDRQNPRCRNDLVTRDIFELLQHEYEQENRYDVIWLQNVLEHVIDPVGLMHTLHTLVKSDGYLVVTVPNDFSELQLNALEKGKIDAPF